MLRETVIEVDDVGRFQRFGVINVAVRLREVDSFTFKVWVFHDERPSGLGSAIDHSIGCPSRHEQATTRSEQ